MRNVLALILAGGKGSRLEPLTRDRAKPAVPFGGVYRIIDFTLSNCLNSGLRRILVLTQYKAASLDRHINLGWRFLWVFGLSLAGSLRQWAGIKEEAEEKAQAHRGGFCHKTICVHRNSAILPPLASLLTTASQTWVVRPRCTGVARQAMCPSRAVPRKLDFSSTVVKPFAPCGSAATQP